MLGYVLFLLVYLRAVRVFWCEQGKGVGALFRMSRKELIPVFVLVEYLLAKLLVLGGRVILECGFWA